MQIVILFLIFLAGGFVLLAKKQRGSRKGEKEKVKEDPNKKTFQGKPSPWYHNKWLLSLIVIGLGIAVTAFTKVPTLQDGLITSWKFSITQNQIGLAILAGIVILCLWYTENKVAWSAQKITSLWLGVLIVLLLISWVWEKEIQWKNWFESLSVNNSLLTHFSIKTIIALVVIILLLWFKKTRAIGIIIIVLIGIIAIGVWKNNQNLGGNREICRTTTESTSASEYSDIPITFYSGTLTKVTWDADPNIYRWRQISNHHPTLLVWDHEPEQGEQPQWIIPEEGKLDGLPATTNPFWMIQIGSNDGEPAYTIIRYAQHEISLD